MMYDNHKSLIKYVPNLDPKLAPRQLNPNTLYGIRASIALKPILSSTSSSFPTISMGSKTIQVTAATRFPIKLNANNFPVWRRQVESALIELELDQFITGNQNPPKRFLEEKDGPKPNP
uniref:Retrotransposon Copia-like N-terminal domain-containing protein n=1 Tax=Lactuca sativa TaxID=4236 RepID=A0A9R1VGR3_LACSA|nr:hypothetical protein LSAT_V11C500274720 [Lactuca sativa]